MAIKDVVPQNQGDGVPANKLTADDEGVGKATRLSLSRIGE